MENQNLIKNLKNVCSDQEYSRIMNQLGNQGRKKKRNGLEPRAGFVTSGTRKSDVPNIGPTLEELETILKNCERKFGV